jgi:O-acetyl-ADP-ribose deacetylase (regulator of RNase III)
VPPSVAADAMLSAVVAHLRAGQSPLRRVVFVLYQDDAEKAFTAALKRLSGTK